jgi:hypothetical protein
VHHFDAFMGEMSTANTIIVGRNQNFKWHHNTIQIIHLMFNIAEVFHASILPYADSNI